MDRPKVLAAHCGRLPFWVALVVALYVFSIAKGFGANPFAPFPVHPGGAMRVGLVVIGLFLAVCVQLQEDQRRVIELRIRHAMRMSDHTIKSASLAYYGDERRAPEFERALRGERPLDIARLEILLGDEFARHFCTLTLIEKGPPAYIRQALSVFTPEKVGAL